MTKYNLFFSENFGTKLLNMWQYLSIYLYIKYNCLPFIFQICIYICVFLFNRISTRHVTHRLTPLHFTA